MIGAGNVATNLAKSLAKAGLAPVQIWSRTEASAAALAAAVGCSATADWNAVERGADIYIVSVKDDAMQGVIEQLCSRCRHGIFVHTAGTVSMKLFEGKAEHYGVLYPMQTFSKQKEVDFRKVPCFVEASDGYTLNAIMRLAEAVSDNVRELAEADRKWLHVAAVFACNFSNACCSMAAKLLESHGLDFSVMLPLVDETIAKLHSLQPREAQTGPAVRGDTIVMGEHLSMLSDDAQLQDVYRKISAYINPQIKNRI